MKRVLKYVGIIMLLSINASGQDVNGYSFTIGTGSEIYRNINGYRLSNNDYGNDFSSPMIQGSFGIDYGQMISQRLRPRIELDYLKQSYLAGWETANISTMDRSVVYLYNLSIGLSTDYLLINKSAFQCFISPSIKWEFTTGKDVENIRKDGTNNWYRYNGIISENPGSIFGGGISTILKYNIKSWAGIVFEPGYTFFFGRYAESNEKSYQRISLGIGLELNFR